MKDVILDTSFIITCVKQKIDFFEDIKFRGLKIIIPKQVIEELKKLKIRGKKFHIRKNAELALRIIELNDFKEIDLGEQRVDEMLIKMGNKNKNIIVATLDREIKNRIKGPKIVIRGKKKLDII